jgi:hypothetical protein
MLSYYLVDPQRLGYRAKFDGVDVGSVAKRYQDNERRYWWHWEAFSGLFLNLKVSTGTQSQH